MATASFPFLRTAPGDSMDALGTLAGKQTITIEKSDEVPTYKTNGSLFVLTVVEWGAPYARLSWFDAMRSFFDDRIVVQPSIFSYPEEIDRDEDIQQGYDMFDTAENHAIGTVFRKLELPFTAKMIVIDFDKQQKGHKNLKLGDWVVAINGMKFSNNEELFDVVKKLDAGPSTWTVVRDTKKIDVEVTSIEDEFGGVYFGVRMNELVTPATKVTFDFGDVGGPSGGLAMGLALYDKLTKEDLIAGRKIAVTGTLGNNYGDVGPIGGIDFKIALAARSGATIMIFPAMNCGDIEEEIPSGLTLYPVFTMDEALEVLRNRDPKKYPTCDSVWDE
jgi:PDZ domain-containing protein